jgi:hypothetical protein
MAFGVLRFKDLESRSRPTPHSRPRRAALLERAYARHTLGFFRTELLTEQSTNFAAPSIADYDERRAKQLEFWKSQKGQQPGDPAKLAQALLAIASQEPPR